MSGLKVIKASAGSGKTHRLTNEYIKLLFSGEKKFRHILAVTFTNKATEEMKSRVVEYLFKMSSNNSQAKEILTEILHDYSSFSISTIDRFFQQTMRAFAREIGKNSAYAVELDQDMILSQAIDNLIMSLENESNSDLIEWLTNISIDSIERGNSWNFKKEIAELSEEIFKESYKSSKVDNDENIFDKDTISILKKELNNSVNIFEANIKTVASEALQCISQHSLSLENFKGGTKTSLNTLNKIMLSGGGAGRIPPFSDTFTKMCDSFENIVSKSLQKNDPSLYNSIERAYENGLGAALKRLINIYSNNIIEYNSNLSVLKNLNSLGLIADIERFVHAYTKDNNLVLIPETTELLNKIIDGNDAPFIYEKTGTRIDHFMLDEFQDTSLMQWHNFKPLILESLAAGKDNLIVGDVKQSIYRWRGSDWSLLNNNIYNDIPKGSVIDESLEFNWRSSSSIIEFNNQFFNFLSTCCDNLLARGEESSLLNPEISLDILSAKSVYSDVFQKVDKEREAPLGCVRVYFTENGRGENDWYEKAMDYTSDTINEYLSKGRLLKDITLLVRTNSQARTLVDFFIEKGYPVISEEALLISSSPVVKKVISLLRYIENPSDKINTALLSLLYIDIAALSQLRRLTLYDMCERAAILSGPDFSESDSLFINSFLDLVYDYGKGDSSDLSSFLKWWEESGVKKSIPAPKGQNALRIMTIHKAKGLGIPIVILPFFEFNLDHSSSNSQILWCRNLPEPYSSLKLIPLKYEKSLANTVFAEDYFREKRRAYIDNLNLAYVAMTRAISEMAIVSYVPGEKSTAHSVSKVLYSMLEEKLISGQFVLGESQICKSTDQPDSQTSVTVPPFKSFSIDKRAKLAFKGEEYYDEISSRGHGLVMHRIMEFIEKESDLSFALDRVISEGILSSENREKTEALIKKMFESVRERHWFDGSYRVFRELDILEPGGGVKRPDRILLGAEAQVIDFKFGSLQNRSHITQVQKYVSLLRETGIAYVKGYVWYPEEGSIIPVN